MTELPPLLVNLVVTGSLICTGLNMYWAYQKPQHLTSRALATSNLVLSCAGATIGASLYLTRHYPYIMIPVVWIPVYIASPFFALIKRF